MTRNRRWLRGAIALFGLLLVGVLSGCTTSVAESLPSLTAPPTISPPAPPTATPKPTARVTAAPPAPPVTSACQLAFAAAASVDAMHDSVSDLYPVIAACSWSEWQTFFWTYDGLGFTGDALTVLANACTSLKVANTPLCVFVRPTLVPAPGPSAFNLQAAIESLCSKTSYTGCRDGIALVAGMAPGSLIAVCDYGGGQGDVVLLDRVEDAATECSGNGVISPSKVVGTLQLP